MLYREDLNQMAKGPCPCGCGLIMSKDNPLSLAAKCHFPTNCKVSYWDGVLSAHCADCGKLIAEIAVANRDQAVFDRMKERMERRRAQA